MGNMLPLNFGVRTKGRIKANTLLNPAFWETFSVKYSLRKEIVHHHMGLHSIGVHILLHAAAVTIVMRMDFLVPVSPDGLSQKHMMKCHKNYK